jgi:PIN domain nuclease of toxin-antitoxin system
MSEVIVLDTHIWFWWINQEFRRFPSHWRDRTEAAEQVGISAISCYEIALAQQRGRLELPCPTSEWFQEALEPAGVLIFSLMPAIASRAVELSPVHKDPFDRLIIATALEYGAKLASLDGLFAQYPELETCLLNQSDVSPEQESDRPSP